MEIVSADRLLIVTHNRSTTFSNVWKTSFRNPFVLISLHICSIGFISGVYGGMFSSVMLSGIIIADDLCHEAPSHTINISSSEYSLDNSSMNTFMQTVLQYGITRKILRPLSALQLHKCIDTPVCDDREPLALYHHRTNSNWVCWFVQSLLHPGRIIEPSSLDSVYSAALPCI